MKKPVFFIDLDAMISPLLKDLVCRRPTSRSLYAARLFRPWTLASFTNLSFACRFRHLFQDEDAWRLRGAKVVPQRGRFRMRGLLVEISIGQLSVVEVLKPFLGPCCNRDIQCPISIQPLTITKSGYRERYFISKLSNKCPPKSA